MQLANISQWIATTTVYTNFVTLSINHKAMCMFVFTADKVAKKPKRLFFVLKGELQHLYYIENPKRSKPDGMIDLNYTSLYPLHESWLSR